MKYSRRSVLGKIAVGASALLPLTSFRYNADVQQKLKGRINHSVCRWCFNQVPLEQLADYAKSIGIKSVELLNSTEWKTVTDRGLTCAMGYGTDSSLTKGFNDLSLHDKMRKDFEAAIPKAADMGLKNLICFSGNANGISSEQGLENCAVGLDKIVATAQKYNITICMELLNSKVDHADYQCDRTQWGVALCDKVGSDHFKLLYDVYHMQIMEGDVIATIRKYKQYIAHYHVAGVPGRHELDTTQELYYPAIAQAIYDTGFTGHIAQEFIPSKPDKLKALKDCVQVCDI
jgi:hydroxypyruvate isomerase